jgi:hypothetical protein
MDGVSQARRGLQAQPNTTPHLDRRGPSVPFAIEAVQQSTMPVRQPSGWRIGGDRGRERALRQEKYSKNIRFVRLQRDHRLHLWYIGKRKQGVLRNHAIPQCTFLTPVGNRCITPCVGVKEPSRSRGVIPTAGGLSVHKGTVCCRTIRRPIQRYWIWRRLCRSISC